jgi:hypothetical protein
MMISDLGLKPKIGTLDDARRKASERYLYSLKTSSTSVIEINRERKGEKGYPKS